MQFRIADSFTKALGKLNAQEQSAAKITVFDLQQDPSAPGLQFHRIDKSKDPNFWAIRSNRDIRLIVHKTAASFPGLPMLTTTMTPTNGRNVGGSRPIPRPVPPRSSKCANAWRRLRFQSIRPRNRKWRLLPTYRKSGFFRRCFLKLSEEDLLGVGVPQDWVEDVRQSSEDGFFEIADRIPAEAAEALLDYVGTGMLRKPEQPATGVNPFDHPDAQRRFRVLEDVEELERALEYPWDQWAIFLHPSQRRVVEQKFSGPARVSGSAGTGKTVVALHRAAAVLKKDRQAKVLLTTFSSPLANALKHKLRILTGSNGSDGSNVTILPFEGVARDLFTLAYGHAPRAASMEQVKAVLEAAAKEVGIVGFTIRFLVF